MKTNRRTSQRRAFTLIEMLVVVLILAILAALIVPRVVNRTGDAKRAKAATDISTLSSMLSNYKVDTDQYPTTEEGLNALRVAPSGANNWRGPYITKELPTDPWGNEYVYESPGSGDQDFVITSYGADSAPGGDGDAADLDSKG
jgi:general secretion pathway protein G